MLFLRMPLHLFYIAVFVCCSPSLNAGLHPQHGSSDSGRTRRPSSTTLTTFVSTRAHYSCRSWSPIQLPSFGATFFDANQRRPFLAELFGLLKPTTTTFFVEAHYTFDLKALCSYLRPLSPPRSTSSRFFGINVVRPWWSSSVHMSKIFEWTRCS